MRALSIVHQADAGPGVFAEEMAARGVCTTVGAERPRTLSDPLSYDAVLTFGGAMNTHEERDHPWIGREKRLLAELVERGTAVLGACLGTQLLAEARGRLGARPSPRSAGRIEVTRRTTRAPGPCAGLRGLPVAQLRGAAPARGDALADSPVCPQAYRVGERAWGVQFHAEVSAADAEHGSWTSARTRTRSDGAGPGGAPSAEPAEIEAWNRWAGALRPLPRRRRRQDALRPRYSADLEST